MYFSPREQSRALGRWYFSVSRRFPNFFLIFPTLGVALGIWLIFWRHEATRAPLVVLGCCLSLFYAGLIVMNLVKRWRGTWDEYCAWAHGIFED